MTSQLNEALVCKLGGSLMYLAYFIGTLSTGDCTPRDRQTSGRLVQELNVCTVGDICIKAFVLGKQSCCNNNGKNRRRGTQEDNAATTTTTTKTSRFFSSISKTLLCNRYVFRIFKRSTRTVSTFNSCTKCVGSSGMIHDRMPDCHPV